VRQDETIVKNLNWYL